MDFLERLKEYTESLNFTPSVVSIGLYNESGNSVAIRPAPSNVSDRDFEKGKSYNFSFQVLVHHKDNLFAYKMMDQLFHEYENLEKGAITSSDGSFNLVTVECTTTPSFIQKTSFGVLYTAIFNAELYIGR